MLEEVTEEDQEEDTDIVVQDVVVIGEDMVDLEDMVDMVATLETTLIWMLPKILMSLLEFSKILN